MSRINGPRVCVLAAFASVGAAHAAPQGSEQRAAALVLSAHHFLIDRNDLNNARQLLINVSRPAREIINRGASMLAGTTTPAALADSGGITVPCLRGGTLSAQVSPAPVRTLRMSWNACVLQQSQFSPDATYHGLAEVELTGDTFTLSTTPSLRLGDATQDFTITTFQSNLPYSETTQVRSINVRMTGDIPMSQQFPASFAGHFVGPFAYELTGFWESLIRIVPPDPSHGLPSEHRQRITAEHVVTSGRAVLIPPSPALTSLDDETWFHSGRFSVYYDNINLWRNINESIDFDELRIRTLEGNERQVSFDGRATITWDPSRGAGCVSGPYTFRTKIPMREASGNAYQFQAGQIVVNKEVIATYSPPAPRDPARPFFSQGPVSLDIASLGRFDYLLESSAQRGLMPIAQCVFNN